MEHLKNHYQKSLRRLTSIRKNGRNVDKKVVAFYEEAGFKDLVHGYFYILAEEKKFDAS